MYNLKAIILLFILSCILVAQQPAVPLKMLVSVPDVRQCTEYSCGASALQAVLFYWGQEYREMTLMTMLHTTPENGTHPNDILRVAKELGLEANIKENLTLADLEKAIDRGIPVIVCCQAWRDEEDFEKSWTEVWESGHYMVVIGYDQSNIYFEDPSLMGSRGVIPRSEFMDRWHDYEGDVPLDPSDRKYCQAGIFIQGEKAADLIPVMYVE